MRTYQISLPILVIMLLVLLSSPLPSQAATDFDFFYFVLQWPGSYCDSKTKCCYPITGKPAADFGIHGLWPNYDDGTYPFNCDSDNVFNASSIYDLKPALEKEWPTLACPSADGLKFWGHEWNKHGTCAEALFDQHQYFETAIGFKKQANLLNVLKDAGIVPDGRFYSLSRISAAIREGLSATAGIECNTDLHGNNQLYQVYICIDNMATGFIDCPLLPRSKCYKKTIEFPPF